MCLCSRTVSVLANKLRSVLLIYLIKRGSPVSDHVGARIWCFYMSSSNSTQSLADFTKAIQQHMLQMLMETTWDKPCSL